MNFLFKCVISVLLLLPSFNAFAARERNDRDLYEKNWMRQKAQRERNERNQTQRQNCEPYCEQHYYVPQPATPYPQHMDGPAVTEQ